jgi:4-amino-4-deoxy-L-arabinose transferase-like glycosyltransferase
MTTEHMGVRVVEKPRASAFQKSAQHVVRWWRSLASQEHALLYIIGIWALASVPQALLHGYHYVEGLTVAIAQSALDDGHWITPYIYNLRWIERPTILPAVIGTISLPFGHVYPFVARLPIILSLLAGILLVWRALLSVASKEAALFGAAIFLSCPIVIRYYVTSVADMPLAVLLFAAFLLWWNAYAAGRISMGRWIGIGCLLAVAALMKGPQPVAYFGLGVASFILLTSTWWQLPGLVVAGIVAAIPTASWYAYVFVPGDQNEWLRYTRLSSKGMIWPRPFANGLDFFFETFPASLLATALLLTDARYVRKSVPHQFILALSCYAFACSFVVLFWPAEVNPRYILPMALPLCVLAGIAYDALSARRPALIAGSLAVMMGLLGYAIAHSVGDIVSTPAYSRSKIVGEQIAELVRKAPAPIYRTNWSTAMNELSYVPAKILTIGPARIPAIARPAWIVVPTEEVSVLVAADHGRTKSVMTFGLTALLRSD